MALDEPMEDEESTEINGIGVLLSEHVKDLVDDTIIDYVTQSDGEGFVLVGQNNDCC